MKPQHQAAIARLSHGARDVLLFVSTKKSMVAVLLAVMAKCRGLWKGLTGSSAIAHSSADGDYFSRSYEFSCTATPAAPAKGYGCRRRLPPCVGRRQAREMLASSPECSPEAGVGHEIDGLAEEFINRFHEQLRQQRVAELQVESEN